MLTRYDPDRAPDPERWLGTDEALRIDICRRYHRRVGIRIPNETLHAVIHQVVETQVAMGDEIPVAATLQRLMDEGLSRHDAVHAIGNVLAEYMLELMKQEDDTANNEQYYHDLRQLTAESWLHSADEDDGDESLPG